MQWNDFMQAPSGSQELDATTTWVCPLDNYAVLTVTGEKAQTFLQGQCTCDFNILDQGHFVMGAHCNHKGRMHSTFIGAGLSESEILLRVRRDIESHAQQNLQKYAALSRVNVEGETSWSSLGIVGPQSESIVSGFLNKTGAQLSHKPELAHKISDNVILLCHASNQYELWCCGEIDESTFNDVLALPKQSNGDLFYMLNMQRGIAELESALVDKLLPQELNFQFTHGVSFSKGCYTGQEIVARMHYKAQLKKHMYLGQVDLPSDGSLAASETNAITVTSSKILVSRSTGKSCGMVINALRSPKTNTQIILALCDDDALHDATLQIDENLSLKIQWSELPYAIS